MVQINFAAREINCKIVYYGPGLSGKTTNLEMIHTRIPNTHRGDLTSIATEGDRTLFFDFLPLDLGKVAGMNTRFHLYTVPGQVYYNATRKLVLQGVDGVIFVADSQQGKMQENIESLRNLEENLREYGLDLASVPVVMQYNKRDLPNVIPIEELEAQLNYMNFPWFEATAITGEGVFPTLKKCAEEVLAGLRHQYGARPEEKAVPVAAATPPKPAARPAAPKPAAVSTRPAAPKPPPPPKPAAASAAPVSTRPAAPKPPPPPKPAAASAAPAVARPAAPKPPPPPPKPAAAAARPAAPRPAVPPAASPAAPPIRKVSVERPEINAPAAKKGVSPVLLIVFLILGVAVGLFVEAFTGIISKNVLGKKPPATRPGDK